MASHVPHSAYTWILRDRLREVEILPSFGIAVLSAMALMAVPSLHASQLSISSSPMNSSVTIAQA